MALLEAHTRSASPAVPVMPMVPRPPTLALEHASSSDATNKKIKKGQGGKGPEDAEKWEVTHSSQQPSSKKAWTTKAKQKKGTSTSTSKELKGEQPHKPSPWRPSIMMSSGGLVLDDANPRDP